MFNKTLSKIVVGDGQKYTIKSNLVISLKRRQTITDYPKSAILRRRRLALSIIALYDCARGPTH